MPAMHLQVAGVGWLILCIELSVGLQERLEVRGHPIPQRAVFGSFHEVVQNHHRTGSRLGFGLWAIVCLARRQDTATGLGNSVESGRITTCFAPGLLHPAQLVHALFGMAHRVDPASAKLRR